MQTEKEEMAKQLENDNFRLLEQNAYLSNVYNALLEMSQDIVFMVDKDEKCLFVNNTAASLFSKKPQEMIGEKINEFFPPHIAKYQTQALQKVFDTGEFVINEMPFLIPSNRTWALGTFYPVKNSEGIVTSVVGITRDITEQKLAENALKESEERFRQTIEQMPYPVVMCAADGTTLLVNSSFCEIFKIPTPDLLIGKLNLFNHPCVNRIGIQNVINDVLAGKTVFIPEIKIAVRENERLYTGGADVDLLIEASIFPVYLLGGELMQIVIIFKDIAERKKSELAVSESERKMRTQYKCFPIPTYTWQAQGDDFICVDFNDAAFQFTNGHIRDILGQRVSEIFIQEPQIILDMKRCLQERTVVKRDTPLQLPTLSRDKFLNLTYVNVDHDLIMVHAEDISDKQRLEKEIRKAEHLESLGLLAGGIAHDFNNLLAGVFGYIGLAREYGKNNENVRDCLDKAMLVFGQAKALTQQLRTFSKGGTPIRKLASIGELLRDMSSFVLTGSNCKARFDLASDLWVCEVDAGQLGEVISNLLINCQQAMPHGGVITISAENLIVDEHRTLPLKNGNYVKIRIKDQGIGIPQHLLENVFDPFFTTKQRGSGLGLSIAYSIIKKHEGYIELMSEVGIGTEVSIYLPASQKGSSLPPDAGGKRNGGQGKILLMDDEKFLRDAIGKVIKSLGYTVETAQDGAEAVEMYGKALKEKVPFDIAILDLTIPGGMGGKETLEEIKRIDPKAKTIATSGYSEDPIIADPKAFGFIAAIRKPYAIEELQELLLKVISVS